ncbi:hypothetical protein J6590_000458 [Homalodisca vitripennis]|nr:hypothetical protein J6590_000458 [Homalodisca vitripennis]
MRRLETTQLAYHHDLTDVRDIFLMGVMKQSGERMRRLELHTISLPSLTSLMHGDIVRGERMRRLELHTISLPSLTSLMHGDISVMGVMKQSEERMEIRISHN